MFKLNPAFRLMETYCRTISLHLNRPNPKIGHTPHLMDYHLGIFSLHFSLMIHKSAHRNRRNIKNFILFIHALEASDEVLIRRYSENRRRHPIAKPGETTADAIQRERLQLQGVRDRADMIIDTSRLRTSALRNKLRMAFSELSDQQLMDVHVFSFGFKHGMPVEADIMIDVRFLPNPFYDPEMRTMTGLDKKVSDFVLDHPKTQEFWKAWTQLLDTVMPGYIAEGKPQLSIAIGCTGGQHRSVAIAEATARYLEGAQYHVSISHRDLSRANTKA